VPLFAAMAIGPVLSWKRADLGAALMRLWWAALAALAVGLFASTGAKALPAAAFGAAAWLILGALADVVDRVRLFRIPLLASAKRLGALPRASFGTTLAHAGMGVTIAGIAGMSLATSSILLVKPGETIHLAGYDWLLMGLHDAAGPNYEARVADIDVSRDGHLIAKLSPERRNFPVQRVTTTEAKIATNGFRDLYAVLGEERDGGAVLRLHYNPLAPWIWLGALVMACGGLLSLADRRLRVGAPARRGTAVPVAS
jgi:cytochrome c-type biogenesis protein CcmF